MQHICCMMWASNINQIKCKTILLSCTNNIYKISVINFTVLHNTFPVCSLFAFDSLLNKFYNWNFFIILFVAKKTGYSENPRLLFSEVSLTLMRRVFFRRENKIAISFYIYHHIMKSISTTAYVKYEYGISIKIEFCVLFTKF